MTCNTVSYTHLDVYKRQPLPGGSSIGLSLLVLILIPSGIYFTIKTRFLPFRLFPEMLKVVMEKKNVTQKNSISGVQALIISTATRVGMGNLVGVVAAISAGGAGAVFWMWITALLGSSTDVYKRQQHTCCHQWL